MSWIKKIYKSQDDVKGKYQKRKRNRKRKRKRK